jgi:hypothetical protein
MFISLNLKDYGLAVVGVVFRKLFADIHFDFLWCGELAHEVCLYIYVHPIGCVLI